MYSKLFDSMYDGTLATKGPWQAVVTFQQMLILCDPTGTIDMTAEAIARRTTIPIDVITTGIAALEAPDAESRMSNDEGRRIVRLDDHRSWGWQIVNFVHYRNLRDEDARREYQRDLMRKRRAKANGADVSAVSSVLAPVSNGDDVLAGVSNVSQRSTQYAVKPKTLGQPDGFPEFWDAYPNKVKKQDARTVWAKLKPDDVLRSKIHAALEAQKRSELWARNGGEYVPHPTTWLNGARWEDEGTAPAARTDGQKMRAAL
jgi:hypothetical protein